MAWPNSLLSLLLSALWIILADALTSCAVAEVWGWMDSIGSLVSVFQHTDSTRSVHFPRSLRTGGDAWRAQWTMAGTVCHNCLASLLQIFSESRGGEGIGWGGVGWGVRVSICTVCPKWPPYITAFVWLLYLRVCPHLPYCHYVTDFSKGCVCVCVCGGSCCELAAALNCTPPWRGWFRSPTTGNHRQTWQRTNSTHNPPTLLLLLFFFLDWWAHPRLPKMERTTLFSRNSLYMPCGGT